jgi:hypothetical protein
MTAAAAVAAALLVPASAGTSEVRPPVSLVAAPAHVSLTGNAKEIVRVTNSGRRPVVVDVSRAGFTIDLRGRPRIVRRGQGLRAAGSWLTVRPARLSIPSKGSASLTIAARVPRRAEPGDHGALVLLTTRPLRSAAVMVRMRLGVVVVVRAPGAIVRRLALLRLSIRRGEHARALELLFANRGNVSEVVGPCLTVTLHRAGKVLARLRPAARRLLPRARGIVELRYPKRVRGWVKVHVEPSGRLPCSTGLRHTTRVHL